MTRKLTRSDDRWLAGVCGGIAEYFGWDPGIVRLVAILAAIFASPAFLVAYAISWVVIPKR